MQVSNLKDVLHILYVDNKISMKKFYSPLVFIEFMLFTRQFINLYF